MECGQENTAVECVVRGGGGGGEESGVDLEVISWQIHHSFFVFTWQIRSQNKERLLKIKMVKSVKNEYTSSGLGLVLKCDSEKTTYIVNCK